MWRFPLCSRGYQQQDAHEFMRYLLDRLHTELLTLLPYPYPDSPYLWQKGKTTIVTSIFGGILQSEVHCLICAMDSNKHDPFLDLSLDIPSKFTTKTPNPKNGEPVCDISGDFVWTSFAVCDLLICNRSWFCIWGNPLLPTGPFCWLLCFNFQQFEFFPNFLQTWANPLQFVIKNLAIYSVLAELFLYKLKYVCSSKLHAKTMVIV